MCNSISDYTKIFTSQLVCILYLLSCLQERYALYTVQDFIQALLMTSVFHEGLSFTAVGHDPLCISTLALAAGGSRGHCKSHFGYFSDPRLSNSLSTHHSVT